MRGILRVVAFLCLALPGSTAPLDWKAQPDPKPSEKLDFGALAGSGTKVLNGFSGDTDGSPWGVLQTYDVTLPAFRRALFFAHATKKDAWPNMRNQGYPYFASHGDRKGLANLRDGILFFLLPLKDGGHLAVTSMSGIRTQSWFHTDKEGRFLLSVGTFGKQGVESCDVPLFAWARCDDVYEACHRAIASGIVCKPVAGRARLRHQKPYRDYFTYLGWCSWEHFKGKIDEQNMLQALGAIETSGVPVRYAIIDMGHTANKGGAMYTFKPNPTKFPNEWAPLLKCRKPEKIRWMCLWHDYKGYSNGLYPENDFGEALNRHLVTLRKNSMTVRNAPASSLAFYKAFMGSVKAYGFDFVKIDFQSAQLRRLAGLVDNAAEMCINNSSGFEEALQELDLGLINCNWHNPVNFFNCRYSNTGRCSMDYVKHNLFSARRHLFQSYANTLWMGQLVWPDHDMFHSSDHVAGRTMAVSKAVSGGPVYLSDDPMEFDARVINPLCYKDGRLLRPLAPAMPLPDSIFVDPYATETPYRVAAPLPNRTAVVVVYNLRHKGDAGVTFSGKVTPGDYRSASGMMQPYPGAWKMPAEGLVLYDGYAGKGWKFEKDFTFELKGLEDRFFQLVPIRKGWAVIGRTDKYLSAAAVEVVSVDEGAMRIKMIESGPLAIWSERGVPKGDVVSFQAAGKGVYKADIHVGGSDMMISVTR
jgi:hypothetical protein